MEEKIHVNGQDVIIKLPDRKPGEGKKLYAWRCNTARSAAIAALLEGPTTTGFVTSAAQAHEHALHKIFGRHVPPSEGLSGLVKLAQQSRSKRRSGG